MANIKIKDEELRRTSRPVSLRNSTWDIIERLKNKTHQSRGKIIEDAIANGGVDDPVTRDHISRLRKHLIRFVDVMTNGGRLTDADVEGALLIIKESQ